MPVSEYKKSDLLAEMSLSNLSQVINKLEKVTCLTESQKQNTTTSTKSDVHSTTLV